MRDTLWLAEKGWGVFCHYLGTAGMAAQDWNRQVEAVDVEVLAHQLASAGAAFFFISLGQGSGHYCAPNATYDQYVGDAESKCSRRDLVSDLYAALQPLGIDLLAYVPADGSWGDAVAREKLGQTSHWSDDPTFYSNKRLPWERYRLPGFQRRWESVCRDWSLRFGSKIKGWWVDGCFGGEDRYPEQAPPNFHTFADALRGGNPDALIAFNPGVAGAVSHVSDDEDFTAGEAANALPVCQGPFVRRRGGHAARFHVLTYLGEDWNKGNPRFPDDLVIGYTQHMNRHGGVITWDVPISAAGCIPEPFLRQLSLLPSLLPAR